MRSELNSYPALGVAVGALNCTMCFATPLASAGAGTIGFRSRYAPNVTVGQKVSMQAALKRSGWRASKRALRTISHIRRGRNDHG